MSDKKIIHIVPHSHWDREWYMSFEEHRFRLVKLMDSLIEKMENDPEFKFYHLDGQMIVLEDYLKIKPYMFDRLKKLINDGRIKVGPWYVLQDEYLTSDEANVRDLLLGIGVGEEMGLKVQMIGYLPDSFGNISQMPQILAKCGIDKVVFGRGVENTAEVIWQAPDGSRVVGGHFTPWYNNAAELPTDEEAARARAAKMLGNFGSASKIADYLGMNGSDHQPVQLNLPQAIAAMNAVTDEDVCFIHSNLTDYMEKLMEHTDRYPVVAEELAGQNTSGFGLLISTASARIYLKQKNRLAQLSLERQAEPFGAMAYLYTGKYPTDELKYAWKRLLENHTHDSICGCSVDEVHREMMPRFDNVLQVAGCVTAEALRTLEGKLKVNPECGTPVAVFNNSACCRSDLVTVTVDLPEKEGAPAMVLIDGNGEELAAACEVYPHTFTYTLPDDAFRVVKYVDRYVFKFAAKQVPAFGYKVFYVTEKKAAITTLPHTDRTAENDFIALSIEDNGSLTVTDKATGKVYRNLNIYEDTADIGDEYLYVGNGQPAVTTEHAVAQISVKETGRDHVTFLVRHELALPETYDRKAGVYSDNRVPFVIESEITLTAYSRKIDLLVRMNNASDCHRLRSLFPNEIKTETVLANGQFDIVERAIATRPNWKWPTNEQRLQSFVALKDDQTALVVGTRALYEYEVLRDGSNTLCLNLLRCTDQLGDWGIFPTPDAECKGINTAEYEISIGAADTYDESVQNAYQFASGEMFTRQVTDPAACDGTAPASLIAVEGSGVWNTAFKKQEKGDGVVLRFYNTRTTENRVVLRPADCFSAFAEADLLENPTADFCPIAGGVELTFAPKEIKTIVLKNR